MMKMAAALGRAGAIRPKRFVDPCHQIRNGWPHLRLSGPKAQKTDDRSAGFRDG